MTSDPFNSFSHISLSPIDSAIVHYDVLLGGAGNASLYNLSISVLDEHSQTVAIGKGLSGDITINNPILWWPYGLNETIGYRYTLEVRNFSHYNK